MQNILVLTVGGAPKPILTSIRVNRPDYVVFLCSDTGKPETSSCHEVAGEGNVIKSTPDLQKPDQPNIVTQAGLSPEMYELVPLQKYDSLNDVYIKSLQVLQRLFDKFPHARITCDYTGGTKTMASGFCIAAIDDGRSRVIAITGPRSDKIKVSDGMEQATQARVQDIHAQRNFQLASSFLNRYDYAAAEEVLSKASLDFAGNNAQLQRRLILCRAFNAWDSFNHAKARELLNYYKEIEPQNAELREYYLFLDAIERNNGHGFELVEDLLMNAQRRASQGRFDDAIGRLYRAIEMTAQIWLEKFYQIDCGNVETEKIPESAAKERLSQYVKTRSGYIKAGLGDSWEVIEAFSGDPAGHEYTKISGDLINFMNIRNASLFAHGKTPIEEDIYKAYFRKFELFLRSVIDIAAHKGRKHRRDVQQLPSDWI